MTDIVEHLRTCAADPMWADHCEMSKRTVSNAADEIERLRAELDALKKQEPVAWMNESDSTIISTEAKERLLSTRGLGGEFSCAARTADRYVHPLYRAPQPETQDDWQPIETAPTNGEAILIANSAGVWAAKYKAVYQSGYKPESPWMSLMLNKDHIPARLRHGKPTHWMPLPAAPKPGDAE